MGLRRRRKKLTSVITNVDKRLKAVEFRHVPTRIKAASITTEEIADGTIPPEDPKDSGATGATASTVAPSEFATLVSAAYSSRIITGSVDRVDIVTTQPHGFVVGDKVTVYGVNNSDVDLSGTYKVTEVPSTTEFRYTRGLTGPYPTVIHPVIKYGITSKMATLTEAGLILTGVGPTGHGFKQGEAITISGVGEPFDGTFLITDISDDHIYYKFATPISASISWTSATGYANATVHKYAIVGDTWIDTSVNPSVVKVWSGLAWVSPSELPEGVIVNDHMAPKAPTNLRAALRGYYSSDGSPRVQATLSWDAPTENADGTALSDLGGYKVFHKVVEQIEETTPAADGGVDETTPATDGSLAGTVSYFNETGLPVTVNLSTSVGTIYPTSFNIRAGNQYMSGSHAWTVSGLTNTDSATISWSTSPSAGSGSITGSINSTTVVKNYTPGSGDINGDIAITGRTQTSDTVITPPENPTPTENQWESDADTIETSTIIRDLPMDSQVMFMVQAYDSSKLNVSTAENVLTISTGKPAQVILSPSKPGVEARLGTVTVTWDGQDYAGSTPPPQLDHVDVHVGSTSGFTVGPDNLKGRIEPGIEGYLIIADLAYGSTWYAKLVFVSKTGVATLPSVASDPVTVVSLVNTDMVANTLTTWPFQGQVVNLNALADGSVNASKLVANAVTQAAISANAIGADQIIAGAVGAGKIAANAITAGTIAANAITAGNIQANAIEADKIKAGALDAFLITGAQIQTAATGGRIVLNSSGLTAYASNGTTQTFNIAASTGNLTLSGYIAVGGAASDVNSGSGTIGGTKITPGSIQALQISANAITAEKIVAGVIDGSKISATTVFSLYDPAQTLSVRMGYQGIPSAGDSAGVTFFNGSTALGWIGAWGDSGMELGTDFFNNYIDFYSGNQMNIYSTGSGGVNFAGSVSFNGTRLYNYGRFVNYLGSDTAAMIAYNGYGGSEVLRLNTLSSYLDGVGLYITGLLKVTGNIQYTGTISDVSSERFKLNISPYDSGYSILDIPIVKYQYDFAKIDPSRSDVSDVLIGTIAERAVEVGAADIVTYDKNGLPHGVDYTMIGLLLVPIVKELKETVDELKKKVG